MLTAFRDKSKSFSATWRSDRKAVVSSYISWLLFPLEWEKNLPNGRLMALCACVCVRACLFFHQWENRFLQNMKEALSNGSCSYSLPPSLRTSFVPVRTTCTRTHANVTLQLQDAYHIIIACGGASTLLSRKCRTRDEHKSSKCLFVKKHNY